MKKGEGVIDKKYFFVMAVVLIMSITLLGNTYISKVNLDKKSRTELVVSISDIPENTIITEEMLSSKGQYTQDIDLEKSFVNKTDVVGKKTIVPIYKYEVINKFRITENNENVINKDFAIELDKNDKSLNLSKGTFVDIWKVPIKEGFNKSYLPEIVLERQYIVDVKNESYLSKIEYDSLALEDKSEIFVPNYIVININETQVKKIGSIDRDEYNIRVVLHQTNTYFENLKAIQNTISKKENSTVEDKENNEKQNKNNDEEKVEVKEGNED